MRIFVYLKIKLFSSPQYFVACAEPIRRGRTRMNIIFKISIYLFLVGFICCSSYPRQVCPPLYEQYSNEACFLYRTSAGLTKTKADAECAKYYRGTLASIDNKGQEKWLLNKYINLTRNESSAQIWIGLVRSFNVQRFVWEDGNNVTYLNWAPNQPVTQREPADCAYISARLDSRSNLTQVGWHNTNCTTNRQEQSHIKAFVCRVPILPEFKNGTCLTAEEYEAMTNCWRSRAVLSVAIACLAVIIIIILIVAFKWWLMSLLDFVGPADYFPSSMEKSDFCFLNFFD